ncbi:MAG: hemerythrin domain-containing protein [Sphingobacteriaceae bacterium]|nr:hemerythrin domain-containing protein [Sphingobacteriaceae bacterium]
MISKLEQVIISLNDQWEKNEENYERTVIDICDFIQKYSDGYHHHKEEEVLFPALSEHPEFLLQGILDELKEHHENFRDYNTEIRTALEEKNYSLVQTTLERLINELMDHIAIENDELFIMAENLFTEQELEKMYFDFADIDRDLGEANKLELEKIPSEITLK